MSRPSGSLQTFRRVVFAHAHPDDETLATGALIQHLTRADVAVAVVTATRGERGEVVPGPLSELAGTPDLEPHRIGELSDALTALGAEGPFFLGEPPARAVGRPSRRYVDSGMVWVTPTLAGPGADAGPDAFTSATLDEPADDLAVFLTAWGADLVISYESDGGYGHPDHVRLHHVTGRAAELAGVRFGEIISIPRDGAPSADPAIEWFDLHDHLAELLPALHAHASQFTVDGTDVIHAGGQREALQLRSGIRLRG